MSRALTAVLALAAVAGLGAAPSCQSLPTGTGCVDIPAGGCPTDRGGSCADPDCAAIYTCSDGVWTFAQACNQPDAGSGSGGGNPGGDGGTAGGDGGACTPVAVDTSGQTNDCTPDLAFPDCPFQAAEGCVQTACLTGCSDFFLCVLPGSRIQCPAGGDQCWVDVAYCTDDGQLVIASD